MRERIGSLIATIQFHSPVLATVLTVIVFAAVIVVCLLTVSGLPVTGVQ